MTPAVLTVTLERADSAEAAAIVITYRAELDDRLLGGYAFSTALPPTVAELTPPAGAFFVARLDGVPAGCIGLRRLDDERAEVKQMWVTPPHRGRGIASALLAAAEDAARVMDVRWAVLDTRSELTEALALYRRAGYVEVPSYNQSPVADRWFEKLLRTEG